MKKIAILATAAIGMLASCTTNDFVGDENLREANEQGNGAIVFGTGVKAPTRADKTGAAAATDLNNEFVFAGTKGVSPTSFVFDQYTAKYVANTANTTLSNSSDWEYVGCPLASTSGLTGAEQSIKYWDYGTTQYDFAAYSLGKGAGATPTYASATAIAKETKSYSLTGSADELKACYISDLVTAYNKSGVNDYGNVVKFSFRSLAAKIRVAFYETIPGYSVKEVQFYSAVTGGTAGTTPTLFTSTAKLPSGRGTMTVTFPTTGFDKRPGGSAADPDYNKAHVSFAVESGSELSSKLEFEALADLAAAEKNETAGNTYLGRASNQATYAGGTSGTPATGKYYTVLPYETGANLQLRIKYTLVSTDGSGETITVDNATAVVPAELAKWYPNYAYTYIFKISDMTNGSTGVDGDDNVVKGLTPITLNAVIVENEDGVQETITTVSEPSITTYAEGKVVTDNDEYTVGTDIYIIGVDNDGTTHNDNVTLYSATLKSGSPSSITEATAKLAYDQGKTDNTSDTWDKTDVTLTQLYGSTPVTSVPAVDGKTYTVNALKFTPSAAGTYVARYQGSGSVVYKIIKVVAAPAP